MDQAEQADNKGRSGDPLVEQVAAIVWIESVPMGQERPLITKREVNRGLIDPETKGFLKKTACPEVVVAADQVQGHAGIMQFGKGAKHIKVRGEYDLSVLEPEVKQVSQANQTVHAGGINTSKKASKSLFAKVAGFNNL